MPDSSSTVQSDDLYRSNTAPELLNLILAATRQIFYNYDLASGTIYWGGMLEQILGFTAEELKGGAEQWIALIHPEDRERALKLLDAAQQSLSPYEVEYRFRRKDGRYLWMRDRGLFQAGPDGKAGRMLGLQEDISEHRQAEEEIRRNEARFHNFITHSFDGMALIDEEGKIIEWNPAMARIMDLPADKAVGEYNWDVQYRLTPPERQTPDLYERFRATHQQALQTGKSPTLGRIMEGSYRRADGTTGFLQQVGFTIPVESGAATRRYQIGMLIRDVTEQHQAQERLRRILEASPTAVIITQTQDGKILYANQQCSQELGWSPDELMQMFSPQIYENPADRKGVVTTLRQEGALRNYEVRFKRRNGKGFWVYLSVDYFDYAGEQALLSSFVDVSDRKRAEQLLAESERRLQAFVANQPGIVFTLDTDGDFTLSEGKGLATLGLKPGQVVGLSAFEVYKDTPEVEASIRRALAGEAHSAIVQIGKTVYDTWYGPLTGLGGQVNGVMGVAIDITERRQAEAEILEEKTLLDAAINSMPGVFFMFDAQGKMLRWNKNYEDVTGLSAEKIAEMQAWQSIAPEDQERTARAVERVFNEGETSLEASFLNVNERRTPYLLLGRRVQVGERIYLCGAGVDISERKQLEEEIRVLLERRSMQVQLSTQVAQAISAAPSLQELYERVVTQVKERFGYYHVQILRYDAATRSVVLVSGYGKIGAQMAASGHRLPLGSGLIGIAAASGQTVLRARLQGDSLSRDETHWQPNPLLPETRGEIAVPIRWGENTLGVLDVQSSQAGQLGADDQLLLEGLCGQIAIAIENTRLREEMESRLNELNALYRASSQEGWRALLPDGDAKEWEVGSGEWGAVQNTAATKNTARAFRFNRGEVQPVENLWSAAMARAFDEAGLVRTTGLTAVGSEHHPDPEHRSAISALTVRGGDVIGALGVVEDEDNPLSNDEIALLEQVAEQVALALDSARLFAQTQSTLAESQLLYNISRRLAAAAGLQEVAAAVAEGFAIAEFNRAELLLFDRDPQGEVEALTVRANWQRGEENPPLPLGQRTPRAMLGNWFANLLAAQPFFMDHTNPAMAGLGYISLAGLPLWLGDEQFGVALLATSRPHHFTESEKRPAAALAQQISIAAQNRLLFERTQAALSEAQASQAALGSERRTLQAVLDNMPAGVFVVEAPTAKPIIANSYATELLGKGIDPNAAQGELAEVYAAYTAGANTPYPAERMPLVRGMFGETSSIDDMEIRRPDGKTYLVQVFGGPIYNAEGRVTASVAIFQDITERQRAAEIVARRAHELSLVAELGTKISSILEPSLMLQTVADLVKESFGLYQVLIYLMNERGDLLTLAVGSGETGRRLVAQGWQVSLGNEGTGQDAAAQAARLRQGVIFNDVRAASYTGGTLSLSKDDRNDLLPETRAEMAVPMIVGERVTGVVDIQAAEANRFSEEDVSIHTVLASQVAVALQNSRTYAQTQRQAEYEALINAITQKIQSTTTIENALQVAVRELGRALGVSRASVQLGVNRQKK